MLELELYQNITYVASVLQL